MDAVTIRVCSLKKESRTIHGCSFDVFTPNLNVIRGTPITPVTTHLLTIRAAVEKLFINVTEACPGLARAIVDPNSLDMTYDMTMSLPAFIKLARAPAKRAARENAAGESPAKKQK